MERRDKTVAESRVETIHLVMPSDMNDSGRLFGGRLMCWIDEVAGLVGRRHAQMNVTTGSVDNLKFLRGAYLREMVVISGKVTYVGNASMEVKVETFIEKSTGERDLINRAYLTMVGLDENDKPCRLPRLILETEEDRMEWERAEIRRQIRKKQSAEGFHFFGE
ncbi:MAG: acyl-CoA thioesterase [Deltaproteobacteria bacterium]|nr:acyl-CoA thioesterase [Deltaproteobacteria bacterium]